LDRDLDEDPERLDDDRAEPERLEEAERLEPEPDRFEPERLAEARLAVRLEPEPDRFELELDELEPEPERDADERAELARALLAREPELRDALDERLEPFVLRERLEDDRRELDAPLRRSAAGISSLATAFASCGICFSRNLAMRSSSRRMPRASLTVSLSLTAPASASMPE
jgi:hypothetical protein